MDISRCALLFQTVERLVEAMPKLQALFQTLELRNRFSEPTPVGWRDVNMTVKVSNFCVELQLQLWSFYTARLRGHAHYEKIRSIFADQGATQWQAARAQRILVDTVETPQQSSHSGRRLSLTR